MPAQSARLAFIRSEDTPGYGSCRETEYPGTGR